MISQKIKQYSYDSLIYARYAFAHQSLLELVHLDTRNRLSREMDPGL